MVAIWASWSLWMLLRPYICSPLGVEVLSGEAASCLMFPLEAQSWTILEEARQPGSRATRQRTQLAPPLHNVATRSGGFQSLSPSSSMFAPSSRPRRRPRFRPRPRPRVAATSSSSASLTVRVSLRRRPRLSPRVAVPSSASQSACRCAVVRVFQSACRCVVVRISQSARRCVVVVRVSPPACRRTATHEMMYRAHIHARTRAHTRTALDEH